MKPKFCSYIPDQFLHATEPITLVGSRKRVSLCKFVASKYIRVLIASVVPQFVMASNSEATILLPTLAVVMVVTGVSHGMF